MKEHRKFKCKRHDVKIDVIRCSRTARSVIKKFLDRAVRLQFFGLRTILRELVKPDSAHLPTAHAVVITVAAMQNSA